MPAAHPEGRQAMLLAWLPAGAGRDGPDAHLAALAALVQAFGEDFAESAPAEAGS